MLTKRHHHVAQAKIKWQYIVTVLPRFVCVRFIVYMHYKGHTHAGPYYTMLWTTVK